MSRMWVRLGWIVAAAVLALGSVLAYVNFSPSRSTADTQGPSVESAGVSTTKADSTAATEPNSCSGGINTPGGQDPWGGCWPGPNTTGVPEGTSLDVITGDLAIDQPDYVLEDSEVFGCITLSAKANNVTIRNVRVKANCSHLILNDQGAQNLKVIDSELDGKNFPAGDAGIAGSNYTLTRVDIHSTGDGAKGGSDVLIEDSYIHDLNITKDSHNDALQVLDADGLTMRHNTAIVRDGATSCVILSQNANSEWQMRNVEISRNLLAGGAYVIYGGYQAGTDDASRVSKVTIADNRISTTIFPRGGAFGALTSIDRPVVTQRGNLWADGPNAGSSVE